MELINDLLRDISAYATRRGIALTTFGRLAVNDGKFVGRLREGQGVTVRLIEKARKYMSDNPVAAPQAANRPKRKVA
jgi:hypothetical protein